MVADVRIFEKILVGRGNRIQDPFSVIRISTCVRHADNVGVLDSLDVQISQNHSHLVVAGLKRRDPTNSVLIDRTSNNHWATYDLDMRVLKVESTIVITNFFQW